MKKNLLTIVLALFVVFGVNAQDFGLANAKDANLSDKEKTELRLHPATNQSLFYATPNSKGDVINEGFESGIPADWVQYQIGAATNAEGFLANGTNVAPHSGSVSMYHNDFNADGSVDDWIVMPQISITGSNFELSFWQADYFQSYYEYHGVMISTGSGDPSDGDFVEVYTGDVTSAWELTTIDLSAYDGQNIYIAFRYQGDYMDEWYIDDVTVGFADPHDLGVVDITPTFVASGETVTPQVTIQNFGTTDEATWSVTLTDGTYSSTMSNVATITAGSSLVVDMDAWTPADGTYTLTATVTVTDDANTANDVMAVDGNVAEVSMSYAWDAYPSSGVVTAGPVNLQLPTGVLTDIVEDASSDFIAGADWVEGSWYGVQYAASPAIGPLVQIDPATGALTTIGGGVVDQTSFMYDVNTATAYVMDFSGALYTIDLTDGTTTLIGGSTASIIGAACGPDGTIYAISLDDNLYQISAADGAGTLIGPLGVSISYAQDIAFDRDNNVLYGALYTSTGGLYTIDVTTGAATSLFDFGDEITGFAIPYTSTVTTYAVTFNVDMNAAITAGDFDVATQEVYVSGGNADEALGGFGSYARWAKPGEDADFLMTDVDADGIYTLTLNGVTAGDYEYKYFIIDAGTPSWDVGSTPDNQTMSVVDADVTLNDIWGTNAINDISSEGINVFPNPSNGVFNINVENNYNLEVFDITGRVINTRTLTGNTSIKLDNAGIYFLRFSNEDGSYTQKVIVQ